MSYSSRLRVECVGKTYTRGSTPVQALREVSFELNAGEFAALRGPSGSGKSTLLNVLCGWETADRGSLWLLPDEAEGPRDAPDTMAWAELAFVPQSLGLLEELSLRENVALPTRFAPDTAIPSPAAIELVLDQFGLSGVASRSPADASLGEQQRAAVARALVLAPPILFADEPTAHQDAHWVNHIFQLLRAAADGGAACLVATHSAEGLAYADRVLEMRDGRLDEHTKA